MGFGVSQLNTVARIYGNYKGETTTSEEAGDCVSMKNCTGVVVEGLYCTNAYNDGITSTFSGSGDSSNIMVANCINTACHRDPMSIVEANNVVYQNCIGSYSTGTLEGGSSKVNGLGLDIEPNSTNYNGSSYGVCYNILIAKCDFSNNYWCGAAYGVGNSPSGTWNIWIDQCQCVNTSSPPWSASTANMRPTPTSPGATSTTPSITASTSTTAPPTTWSRATTSQAPPAAPASSWRKAAPRQHRQRQRFRTGGRRRLPQRDQRHLWNPVQRQHQPHRHEQHLRRRQGFRHQRDRI